ATIGHDYIANLEELQSVKEMLEPHMLKISLAQQTRLNGSLAAIQTRLWYVFPEIRVRAGLSRLRSRGLKTSQYLLSNTLKIEEANLAINWFINALEVLLEQSTKVVGIPTHSPARLIWVGFRKLTPQDKKLLSFKDEPPPWQFAVSIDFNRKSDPSVMEKIKQSIESKTAKLKCKAHNRAAHIFLFGTSVHGFEIQLEVCCNEFGAIVSKALNLNFEEAKVIIKK
ncbi:unnamed protein product, partial [marine sediment metagenome]